MKRKKRAVAEPVQVYLDASDRDRLERLARQLDTTKSEVLRRGLSALESDVFDPASHPVLRIIGIARGHRSHDTYDVAREHDRAFAEDEIASWGLSPAPRRRRGR
jgi:hypothetical protein